MRQCDGSRGYLWKPRAILISRRQYCAPCASPEILQVWPYQTSSNAFAPRANITRVCGDCACRCFIARKWPRTPGGMRPRLEPLLMAGILCCSLRKPVTMKGVTSHRECFVLRADEPLMLLSNMQPGSWWVLHISNIWRQYTCREFRNLGDTQWLLTTKSVRR